MEEYRIKGVFDPKDFFLENETEAKAVIWEYGRRETNIFIRSDIELLQKDLLMKKDWTGLKITNKLLIEADHREKRTLLSGMPVNLQIEHTNFCNAKCIMCSHCFTKNHGGKNMSIDELENLCPILPYVEHVTLHGMGEPFMHPHIIDILKMYHSFGIKVTCNTNASVMTDELAEIIHLCFYDIAVSCDSATKEIYESIRDGLSFDRFKDNVRLLRSKGDKLYMRLSVVAMRQNLSELPDIVRLGHELGFNEILIVDVTTQGLLENEADCILNYPSAAQHYLREASDVGKELGIPVKLPDHIMNIKSDSTVEEDIQKADQIPYFKDKSFTEALYQRYEAMNFPEPKVKATTENFVIPSEYNCEGICDFVLERPFINANGDVYLCCTNWLHTVGNIHTDGGFSAVWNGKIMKEIRELFYSGHVPKYCVGCIFLRNGMMCKRIRVTNMDGKFYEHNYDEQISKLVNQGYISYDK